MSVDQYKKEVGMMNLEKLIESREGISTKQFPIPEKELAVNMLLEQNKYWK